MYHPIGIQKLSHAQIAKMLKGERVRVKHGSHHKIHVSEEQHKKIMKAHQKGAGVTMQMDPYQCSQHAHMKGHGEGIAHDVAQVVAPYALNAGKKYVEHKLGMGHRGRPKKHFGGALFPAGYGEGFKHSRHHAHHGKGEGAYEALMQIQGGLEHAGKPFESTVGINPAKLGFEVGQAIGPHVAKAFGRGEGLKKHHAKKHHAKKGNGRKGKGPIGSVLGSLAGEFLPF